MNLLERIIIVTILTILSEPIVAYFLRSETSFLIVTFFLYFFYLFIILLYEKIEINFCSAKPCFYLSIVLFFIIIAILYYSIFYPLTDTEWYYIDIIKQTGSYKTLIEMGEPLYYSLWPVPQTIAVSLSFIMGLTSITSFNIIYITSYFFFFILIYQIIKMITLGFNISKYSNFKMEFFATLSIISIYYIHRPFHDRMQASFGILSSLIIIYLLLKNNTSFVIDRKNIVIIILFLPFFIAHIVSNLFLPALLIFIAGYVFLKKRNNISYIKYLKFALIIILATYIFQMSTNFLYTEVTQISSKTILLIEALKNFGYSRPEQGVSIAEQKIHFIYGYNLYTAIISYGFPLLIPFFTLVSLFFKKRRNKLTISKANTFVMEMLNPIIMYVFALMLLSILYGYYGIENFVARYLYIYGGSLFFIVYIYLRILIKNKKIHYFLDLLTIIIVLSMILEPFFQSWSSLYHSFDRYELSYYYRLNLLDTFVFSKKYLFYPSFLSDLSKHVYIYNNLPRNMLYSIVYNSKLFILA